MTEFDINYLPIRLRRVCERLTPCNILTDIGCDHGYVSAYALASRKAKTVICADISERSLSKAKTLIGEKAGARFVVSDGFDSIDCKVDEAVISGMGGRLIADILSRVDYRPNLVLGAQHDVAYLREFLCRNGYVITSDEKVYDRGKFYDIISAREGTCATLDFIELETGVFYKQKNDDLARFCVMQKKKLLGYKQTERNKRLLEAVEEVMKWQR